MAKGQGGKKVIVNLLFSHQLKGLLHKDSFHYALVEKYRYLLTLERRLDAIEDQSIQCTKRAITVVP